MIFVQPHQRVVADILAYFLAAVIGPRVAPRRVGAPVVVEINPAHPVFAPAVKLPEVKVRGAKMVVYHIQQDRDSMLMGSAYETFKRLWTAIAALDGKHVRRVVAPRNVAWELAWRHHQERVDAELRQVRELLDSQVKIAWFAIGAGHK